MFDIPFRPCVNCGWCCMKVPCSFGERGENGWCKFLKKKEGDKLDTYICAEFDNIRQHPGSRIEPAFGAGCCASLNTQRRNIIQERRSLENVDVTS